MAHHLTRERVEREFGVRVIDLADATGYSPSYISLILSGKREAPLHVRSAIARALGTRVQVLWPSARRRARERPGSNRAAKRRVDARRGSPGVRTVADRRRDPRRALPR
jgi:transcriptional regulator with XRE-family HTH domain